MAVQNYDVGFEEYIIFHRGVAEVAIQEDGHLHVLYQDGHDQDLGDPLGDNRAKTEAAVQEFLDVYLDKKDIEGNVTELGAESKIADAIAALRVMEQYRDDILGYKEDAEAAAESAAESATHATEITEATVEERIESIKGISYTETEEEQDGQTVIVKHYYVDIDAIEDADINSLFEAEEGE